ncbi:hypothetical protein SUDANB1_00487 [Streptomyces sp. enrichment culture]|uniref:hypothetical protein n=1 Tax=Streptomyces sp. enrichment culture TaxID=1795815 RepID=UPI003F54B95C
MTPPETTTVALELAEIRRSVEVGFTEQRGQLALLVQRGEQTDKKLDDHENRLDALEKARWPLPSLAAVCGVGGLAVALWQAAGR